MATYDSIAADVHINNIRGQAPTYMKYYSDLTRRNHVLLALMHKYGMIEYGANDTARIWKMKVREPEVRVAVDTTRKEFANSNPYERCEVDVRGYEASDILTVLQYKQNRGKQQLIDLYSQKMKDIGEAIVKRVQEWIYRDGNAAAYLDGFQGFESCLADDGGTLVTEKIAAASDSYAGHSTALGNFGGTWSTDLAAADRYNAGIANDWPLGQGTSNYDAFTPVLWNWGSSAWTTAGSWEDNNEEVLRESAAVMAARNGYLNAEGAPLVNLLSTEMFIQSKNFYSGRHRILTPFTDGDLGFAQDTLNLDGSLITSDYGCPTGIGYGICPTHIEMFTLECLNASAEDAMIDTDGPAWSTEHQSFLYYASVHGNLRLQPKFITKYANYADS